MSCVMVARRTRYFDPHDYTGSCCGSLESIATAFTREKYSLHSLLPLLAPRQGRITFRLSGGLPWSAAEGWAVRLEAGVRAVLHG